VAATEDSESGVRVAAARALARIGDESALPVIRRLLKMPRASMEEIRKREERFREIMESVEAEVEF
jgi:HEAT repeat protein